MEKFKVEKTHIHVIHAMPYTRRRGSKRFFTLQVAMTVRRPTVSHSNGSGFWVRVSLAFIDCFSFSDLQMMNDLEKLVDEIRPQYSVQPVYVVYETKS